MKKWLAFCLFLAANVFAQYNLIAIIHPQCHHCEKWQADMASAHFQLDGHAMPKVTIKKLTDFDDVNWIMKTFSWRLESTPTFVLMNEDMTVELGKFTGYSTLEKFKSDLTLVIATASHGDDFKGDNLSNKK